MNITETVQNNIRIFRLQGRVDNQGSLDMELSLQEAFEAGDYRMILDLSQVTYINSNGLRILAAILTQTQDNGGDVLLASVSPKVKRVFQLIGFDNFFRLFDTVDAAALAF
jgi:anti-sigma B factor antagonist